MALLEQYRRQTTGGVVSTSWVESVQFSAEEFTRVVRDAGCKLSMDGRGAW